MRLPKQVRDKLMARFGRVVDLQAHPEILDEVADEVAAIVQQEAGGISGHTASPFGVSWMDSWVAHWVYKENMRTAEERSEELATVLRGLVELKFNERLDEIRRVIREHPAVRQSPPDGGTPEPGVPPPPPPAGPAVFVQPAPSPPPPDGGPPEPGVPPAPPEPPAGPSAFPFTPGGQPPVFEPPDAGPPEPGVPPEPSPPPEPTPPTGPQAGFLHENPWILYWFVSVKAPMLLEVIDLHLTRRLQELGGEFGS